MAGSYKSSLNQGLHVSFGFSLCIIMLVPCMVVEVLVLFFVVIVPQNEEIGCIDRF